MEIGESIRKNETRNERKKKTKKTKRKVIIRKNGNN